MAHEITERADGTHEFAFVGAREAIWHGLGNNLEEGLPLERWKTAAGMDFDVLESAVKFYDQEGVATFEGKKVLYRSDTNAPLSVVGDDFKVVQPDEVLEFFRDLVADKGMKLSTAGTLFGGRRFWALAETGRECEVVKGDTVLGHLLLTTAVDGSMATSCKFVSTRVVCNNTLSIAMSEKGNKQSRVTHRSVFDANKVKLDLGLIDAAWFNFMDNMKKLASVKMDQKTQRKFYEELFFDKAKDTSEQTSAAVRHVNRLLLLAAGGSGSDMSNGTAWGTLCGLTEYLTHGTGRRDANHQFWDSYHGSLDKKKADGFQKLMAMAA